MSTHWFTADPHFGHVKVAELRGFADAAEHDETVLGGFYAHLRKGDSLWILGDLTMGGKRREIEALGAMRAFADEVGVSLHMVLGNHDRAHPMHTGSYRAERDMREHMDSVSTARRIKIGGGRALLSHFPYAGDHTAVERYPQWRLPDEGMALIHGHTHSAEKVCLSPKGTVQVCVSLDAWELRPARKSEIADILGDHGAIPALA